jgi:starch phosphorylase
MIPEAKIMIQSPPIAYFSMEIGLDPAMHTYSGGLGILAGDTLRAAADLGVSMLGISLLYRKGYFRQHLDSSGNQTESDSKWSAGKYLEPMLPQVTVTVERRTVRIRAWRYLVYGISGHPVPVYFLDTFLPKNDPYDQTITDYLYGGDERYRLCQEVVLGMGGVAMLRALGYSTVQAFHMNEGHSAFLGLALLEERVKGYELQAVTQENREIVRRQCVFTTHTPVPAGHDSFPLDLVRRVLGEEQTKVLESAECCLNGTLNMTHLALTFSHYINGVGMRHGQVSRNMFPNYPVNSITNGVHAATWVSPPFGQLFDQYVPEWRKDNLYLRYAISIPPEKIQQAHRQAKSDLLAEVARRGGVQLDPKIMTLGFARRATLYKRGDLFFSDLERLKRIAQENGPIQIIYAGKAHPRDGGGKDLIRHIFAAASALSNIIPVIYLEEYDMELAKYMCAGVDLWLNTPQKPLEASGSSGMKAALNGVPSFSILDGWWIEGHIEGVTGWSIGDTSEPESNPAKESASLYDKLELIILPTFYKQPTAFAKIMRSAIATNGSFFNAQRMVSQYMQNAYYAVEES